MHTVHTELASLKPVDMDAGQVFSGKPSGCLIQGYDRSTAYTPAIDPSYILHEASRDVIVWFLNPVESLYVFGPTGCGKTTCIKQLAARLNYPVFEITGHGRLEFADLAGHLTLQDGNMRFEYGPLSLAMRYGGLFLFTETTLPEERVAPDAVPNSPTGTEVDEAGEMFNLDMPKLPDFVSTAPRPSIPSMGLW